MKATQRFPSPHSCIKAGGRNHSDRYTNVAALETWMMHTVGTHIAAMLMELILMV